MNYKILFLLTLVFICGCLGTSGLKIRKDQIKNLEVLHLPERKGEAPRIGQVAPQLQFTDKSPTAIYDIMNDWMFSTFPKVRKEPTRISVSTTIAMWLNEDEEVGHKDAFMPTPNSREFTHLHLDGSIHTVVAREIEEEIILKKWGVRHMHYDDGVKEILVYAPRNIEEVEILKKIIIRSYEYATGLVFKTKS